MEGAFVSKNDSNEGEVLDDAVALAITATAGQRIFCAISYRYAALADYTTPLWNTELFTKIDTDKDITATPDNRTELFYLDCTTSATANITSASPTFVYTNIAAMVISGVSGAIAGFQSIVYDAGGAFVKPSLDTSVTVDAGDITIDVLIALYWDSGFGVDSAMTWAADANSTNRVALNNTGSSGIGRMYMSTNTDTGTVTTAYTRSGASNNMYRYCQMVFRAAVTNSLDTLTSPSAVSSTGNSGTTTGMTAATTLSFAGKSCAITAASTGSFTYTMPSFANGVTYPAMGTQTFTVGDGTLTATKTATVSTLSGYTNVTMGAMDTGEWSIGQDPAIVTGDVIHLPTAAGTLNTDGTLTDYVFGTYTMWRRDVSDGKMYTSTLTVTETGVNVDGGIAIRHIGSRHISGRGASSRHISS